MKVSLAVFLLALLVITEAVKSSKKSKSKSKPKAKKLNPASSESSKPVTIVVVETEEDDEEKKEKESEGDEGEMADRGPSSSSQENDDSDNVVPEFEFALSKSDVLKAWDSAARLTNRNPKIWRVDKGNNVILSRQYTISSPLSFQALINEDPNGMISFEAIQGEYFGSNSENNHKNGLKYRPKDQNQDDLLSLIEIALLGNVSDDIGDSYCWCPSSIHQDLFARDVTARRWHKKLFDAEFKYGMAGHNLAFQHMKVALKDVRHFPESTLNALDQKNTLLYIHNYQPQCSEVVKTVNFAEDGDAARRVENIKTNWGLTRVCEFIEKSDRSIFNPPSAVTKKSVVIKPKQRILASSIVNPPKKSTVAAATASMSMSENEWPSLSSSLSALSSNETTAKKKTKTSTSSGCVVGIKNRNQAVIDV